jgi:hypothetical protein
MPDLTSRPWRTITSWITDRQRRRDTGRLLSDAGIRWGALVPAEAKQEPVMLTVRGIRVGFLFYCDPSYIYSCAPEYRQFAVRPPFATEETLVRDIRELKTKADILVVSIHWGTEYQHVRPESQTISRARWIIDQGADILIGHHPHVQHGVEIYKRGVIFYSLGNFVFDQSVPVRRVSRLYRVTAGTDGVRNVAVLPLEIRFDTWEPVPITSGYVGLDADTAHRRSALAGTSPPWRVWMPKFWRRDYWLSGSRGGGDRGRRQRPGAQSRARAPGVAQLPPQMGLAGTGRERARRRVRET